MIVPFRRKIQSLARDLAPLSLSLVTLALVGLGFRIADQWHRHEGPEIGYTHLHAFVGDHHHDGDDGPRQRHDDPAAPSENSESCAVLTFTLGVLTAPEPPAVGQPTTAVCEHRADHLSVIADARLDREPWSPRAPPA